MMIAFDENGCLRFYEFAAAAGADREKVPWLGAECRLE